MAAISKKLVGSSGFVIAIVGIMGCGAQEVSPSGKPNDGGGGASQSDSGSAATGGDATAEAGPGPLPDASSGGAPSPEAGSDGALTNGLVTTALRGNVVDKVDILFMIDNSSSMGDKQALLALAVPDMIGRLVAPNCVDSDGTTLGPSSNGTCATGKLEFAPVHDMHLGIVSSSLGGRGSNSCDPTAVNPANPSLPSHNDDRGELINRGGANETPVPNAGSLNFLAWFPPTAQNTGPGVVPPPIPETQLGDANTPGSLIGDFTNMVTGVHEHGCGFEGQNEAWYRFLVQPDPYDAIQVTNLEATYVGIDSIILAQRAAFLRPDSLLAVVVVTDETQEIANPQSLGRLGWLFEQSPWPGSTTGAAPEGSIECLSNPNDANCVSCTTVPAASSAARCPDDPPLGTQGYLDPSDDAIDVRFFHQKQRFGVYAGYPSTRYVTGLTSAAVPDRDHEVDANGNYVGDQPAEQNCVNPIFATNLPTDPTGDLCHLTRGPRTPDLVYYAVIGGVPHQLLQAAPGDPECPRGTAAADCPQKALLSEVDWQTITGRDPENYDFTGVDFHMLESEAPRPGAICLPGQSVDTCDPINGREWNTSKKDLQFACVFDLQAPKDCTQMQYAGACDCAMGSNTQGSQLCQQDANGNYTTTQIRGKAYPGIAELVVAHALADQPTGVQGIVSSLCPIHTTASGTSDPVYGYRPAVNAIINRLKSGLTEQCLPVALSVDPSTGDVPCLVLVTLPLQGAENSCNNPAQGLSVPSDAALAQVQAAPHAAWLATGGVSSGQPDPSSYPTCVLEQLTPQQFPRDFAGGSCSNAPDPGWCYLQGAAASACTQQITFTVGEPQQGATAYLQCGQ